VYYDPENDLKSDMLSLRLHLNRILNRGFIYTLRLVSFQMHQFIAYSTPGKFVNFVACKTQKWLKRERVWGMPYRYHIDPVNICNLKCPLCPTGLGILGRERGRIDFDQYKRIIDQIVPYAYYVELFNWGEPFLHPLIFDIIQYAHVRKIAVRISTNMNRFNREMAAKTVNSGLNALVASVDGADQETYEKYRRGGQLTRVLDNLQMLVDEKRKAKSRTPFITLRMLINRYNENQINSMRELSVALGVDAFSTIPTFVDTSNPEQVAEWLPNQESFSYYDYSSKKLENVWHCSDLWESMIINWDGGLAPCCWLHNKDFDFDNAFSKPLKDIWNGVSYMNSRRVFRINGPDHGSKQTICTICQGRPQYLKD
jgi:MoaA/NifB/PqqE/SkfB family radical SAM enzyme